MRARWPRVRLAGLMLLASGAALANVTLHTSQTVVDIATVGGLPLRWESCASSCDVAGEARQALVGAGAGSLTWRGQDAAGMAARAYAAEITETPDAVVAVLTAVDASPNQRLVQRYELSRRTHTLRLQLQAPAGVSLHLAGAAAFVPAPLPGFGAVYTDVEVVRVTASGQEAMAAGTVVAAAGEWFGMRQHFWAWLVRPAANAVVIVDSSVLNQPQFTWPLEAGVADLTFYAGPVQWAALRAASGVLTQMLFAALWEPLRWLCYGLLFLLAVIMGWVGSAGLAIILLSLAVKLMLWPLTRIADRWQQEVNRIQSRIQPRISEIRRHFKGEEAHNLTLQVYREEGVHPLFTLKSLAGFAIQVPMFIAAFDMLADNFALSGVTFFWVADLAAPDRFALLPWTVPFFGSHVNLLPVIMTLFTVLSALTQRDDSLTPELLRRQRLQLYLMAVGFFLLFYTFPAGMVLYWTANNFWHFLKVQALQLAERRS